MYGNNFFSPKILKASFCNIFVTPDVDSQAENKPFLDQSVIEGNAFEIDNGDNNDLATLLDELLQKQDSEDEKDSDKDINIIEKVEFVENEFEIDLNYYELSEFSIDAPSTDDKIISKE